MLKSCPYCHKIHEKSFKCPKAPKKKKPYKYRSRFDRNDIEAVKFRSSSAWTKKAIEIKERDMWRCLVCRDRGVINYRGLEVHHIEKVTESERDRLNDENLITLCADCHKKADNGELKKGYLKELVKKSTEEEAKIYGQG